MCTDSFKAVVTCVTAKQWKQLLSSAVLSFALGPIFNKKSISNQLTPKEQTGKYEVKQTANYNMSTFL